ncbi:MAG: hypothetical protein COY58_02780 [Gammaproteobacteria bacterium CG_4_10_14_0_8_um_filter_38_16]|nr:MAG: hypothetical protein COY58_02780 [Gammaproteobacteria bacterium CG_4_10_14_0_8_um_filter_38_16]PJA03855.1 MAG: hypothetical protein COX72_02940 [Gammaproteobacteria bacterium CG_4_10_14_0_2_um_filter_38_22]PJB10828.1 MAG: hypothetical protein CO120_03045 [Gammaproteobacteria bacterium CG_4_9_14_3_um_filter_38_9]
MMIFGDMLSTNLITTMISFFSICIIYLIVSIVFIRKIKNDKMKKKVRVRAFYISVLIFLFLMARVWVDGFMHLIAVLGLVSAGLVVTNKESIMNLVGWMIITWRGVFSEDDLIQIQSYKGYVKSIGLLYICLQEVSDNDFSRLTGKEIKVPNGLTANNAVINFTQTARLILTEYKTQLPLKNFNQAKEKCMAVIKSVLKNYYKKNTQYSVTSLQDGKRSIRAMIELVPKFIINDNLDMDKPVSCSFNYYCFIEDRAVLQNLISEALIDNHLFEIS